MCLKKVIKIIAAALCISVITPVSVIAAPADASTELETEQDITIEREPETIIETEPETIIESEDEINKTLETEITTNEELIEQQEIVNNPYINETFRFIKIKKIFALAKKDNLLIREKMDEDSRTVGRIRKKGLFYVIQEEENEWYYVESDDVRGFVKKDDLILGEKAKKYVKKKGEDEIVTAKALVKPHKNKALTHTKTTARNVVVKKKFALALEDGTVIREKREEDAEQIGVLPFDGICYILADEDESWVYVESGDVRGFVQEEQLLKGNKAKKKVKKIGEDQFALADELIAVENNKACYYTITSVQEASIESSIRTSMVNYASQFIGNPYVWGGTSLTNGADCSGFVQTVYGEYGYSLPRVAEDQAQYGMKIPAEEALPGDLIFYARNGYIYHVVMCIGDGVDVEAQSSATGIVKTGINYGNAVWATRLITEEDEDVYKTIKARSEGNIEIEGVERGELLGNFKLTAYCSCPKCCGVWSGGPTASGLMPTEGRTVAMAGVPFGTQLVIGDKSYTVEDRGTPYGHVDIYMNSHQDASIFGLQYSDVYLVK